MAQFNAKKIYQQIKNQRILYDEEVHCPMVLEVMNKEGTMTAFCKKALISDGVFWKWCQRHPVFQECYQLGKIISKANWEKEGEDNLHNEEFNWDFWRIKGACRYGHGKSRVRMGIDPTASPYEQYKQLCQQAGGEEFSASEIKQLMESINVGIRAYESFELQEQINNMKEDVNRMRIQDANDNGTIASAKETD